jgi:hypothetical protein
MNLDELKQFLQYESFIVFESFSERINSNDILLTGENAVSVFNDLFDLVSRKDEDIKYLILLNKLKKIQSMILQTNKIDSLIVTKFVNRIWHKHRFLSSIGENFVNLNIFFGAYKNKDFQHLLATKKNPEDIEEEETLNLLSVN